MFSEGFRPLEIASPGDLTRRIALLVATTVRQKTNFWVVDRLCQNEPRQTVRDRLLEDQIFDGEIDPVESFALAWQILRWGMKAILERAKLRLHIQWRYMCQLCRLPKGE